MLFPLVSQLRQREAFYPALQFFFMAAPLFVRFSVCECSISISEICGSEIEVGPIGFRYSAANSWIRTVNHFLPGIRNRGT